MQEMHKVHHIRSLKREEWEREKREREEESANKPRLTQLLHEKIDHHMATPRSSTLLRGTKNHALVPKEISGPCRAHVPPKPNKPRFIVSNFLQAASTSTKCQVYLLSSLHATNRPAKQFPTNRLRFGTLSLSD